MNIKEIIDNIDINNDKYIIVGVSAGPDSMALLYILKTHMKCNIVCAHINHNVRIQSNEEEAFLKEYCQNNNIIFECMKIKSYQKNNFENEAREKRYNFYEKLLKKYDSHNLFLAHHGDDLIETVIMKIVRGSNLEGYAGIKTYSYLQNYKIVRPLLRFTKEDILKYNKEHKVKYYLDISNEDTKYTRNRYRKYLLPLLKQEDKDVHLKFFNYSNTLVEYDEYINYEASIKLKSMYKNNRLDLTLYNTEHPFMKKNILYYLLSDIYDNQANIIKDRNVSDIIKMSESQKPNYIINLPQGYVAKKEYNYIYIEKKEAEKDNYKVKLKKSNIISNIKIDLIDNIETDGNDVCRLNSKDISLPLYLRNKLDGDYIYVKGLNGKKKIKDIFIDEKIPKSQRDSYPLLVDSQNNILWIPGVKKTKYSRKKEDICDIILTSHVERKDFYEEKSK